MRYAELVFLALLVVYHLVLLLPRHRRPFTANYLIFLSGLALAWNLGLEGLRWQTLLPTLLLLVDLAVLLPTFATLRGFVPRPGFLLAFLGSLRFLTASAALLTALASVLLAIAFPLPRVELTGGIPPGQRLVRFPPTEGQPGLEVMLWYPASGDSKPQPRPAAESETWQRIRNAGGLPVFWQSYLSHLPTTTIQGGKLAAPKMLYPVVYVVVPAGQEAWDFGYLWEDLASRGFLVAAGRPIPPPAAAPPPFEWSAAWSEISRPFWEPALWLEPEADLDRMGPVPDGLWLKLTQKALEQLAAEPGDLLYSSLDWERQGLWVWGSDSGMSERDISAMGIRAVIRAGAIPGSSRTTGTELWISPAPPQGEPVREGRWTLTVPGLHRADLADAAYLKPYLAFFGLKSQADAGHHGTLRQYQAAFFQHVFWNSGDELTFGQSVPKVSGLELLGR